MLCPSQPVRFFTAIWDTCRSSGKGRKAGAPARRADSDRGGRQLAAGGLDVAAAGEADGGGDAVLGEDRAKGLDPLRRGAVVGAGRVVGDEVDLVAAGVEPRGQFAGVLGVVVDAV